MDIAGSPTNANDDKKRKNKRRKDKKKAKRAKISEENNNTGSGATDATDDGSAATSAAHIPDTAENAHAEDSCGAANNATSGHGHGPAWEAEHDRYIIAQREARKSFIEIAESLNQNFGVTRTKQAIQKRLLRVWARHFQWTDELMNLLTEAIAEWKLKTPASAETERRSSYDLYFQIYDVFCAKNQDLNIKRRVVVTKLKSMEGIRTQFREQLVPKLKEKENLKV